MHNIYGINYQDLEKYFESINEKKFRASQVYEYLYQKNVREIDKIANIGKVKETLKKDFQDYFIKIITKIDGENVSKYLFELVDGNTVEAVLMYHDYGISICISTQVGCNMGCKFCESGRLKKIRNLESYEMIQQIMLVSEDINKRITHVVIMGIGEPFDNYDNVMNFIKIINHPKSLALGTRHITVSTCGLVPMIKRFSEEEGQVNLAISLHAPDDEIRNTLMPINKAYNLETLLDSIKEYINKTNRRVTFEYILLKDINDTQECAYKLANLIKGFNAYVNLIPYNETSNIVYKRSNKESIMAFYDILKKCKIPVTIRKEFGGESNAACGQLRACYKGKED